MNNFLVVVKMIDKAVQAILRYIAILMFVTLMVILSLNILNRLVPMTSFHWLDEIVELCFAAMVFFGAASVWINKGHFSAGDWLYKTIKSAKAQALYRIGLEAASLLFAVIMFRYSWNLMIQAREVTAVFQIPKQVLYACMPISSAIISIYSATWIGMEIAKLVRNKTDLA